MNKNEKVRSLLLVLLLSFFSACGLGTKLTSHNPNAVDMTAGSFTTDHITITVGSTIDFINNADTAALHILSLGMDGDQHNQQGAPNFNGTAGIRVNQGTIWTSPVWKTVGTYHVTCTVHPMMNLTVTVISPTPALPPNGSDKSHG